MLEPDFATGSGKDSRREILATPYAIRHFKICRGRAIRCSTAPEQFPDPFILIHNHVQVHARDRHVRMPSPARTSASVRPPARARLMEACISPHLLSQRGARTATISRTMGVIISDEGSDSAQPNSRRTASIHAASACPSTRSRSRLTFRNADGQCQMKSVGRAQKKIREAQPRV